MYHVIGRECSAYLIPRFIGEPKLDGQMFRREDHWNVRASFRGSTSNTYSSATPPINATEEQDLLCFAVEVWLPQTGAGAATSFNRSQWAKVPGGRGVECEESKQRRGRVCKHVNKPDLRRATQFPAVQVQCCLLIKTPPSDTNYWM